MTKKQYENATGIFSTQLAISSFIIGTILLILHLINPTGALFGVGAYYLILAFVLNLIMLFRLTYLAFTQKNHQDYFTIKILILLANIPIAFVYLRIVGETWK
jgi:membrane-bound ClpP family serine protease